MRYIRILYIIPYHALLNFWISISFRGKAISIVPKEPLFKCGLISVQYEIHQNIIHNTITHALLNFWISVSIRGKAILWRQQFRRAVTCPIK